MRPYIIYRKYYVYSEGTSVSNVKYLLYLNMWAVERTRECELWQTILQTDKWRVTKL
jgi:hypothetical protein